MKDDGSTDHTVSIVKDYAHKWPNVRLVQNEQNLGITKNFISGFFLAQGDYIAYSDQDDVWHPQKLELLLEAIGDGNMAYSNSAICDVDGQYIAPLMKEPPLVSELISLLDLTIWGHQILFKKEILYGNDVYTLARSIWLDSLIPILAFKQDNNNVVYVHQALVNWRRHPNASGKDDLAKVRFTPPLFFKLKKYFNIVPSVLSWFDKKKRDNTKRFYKKMKGIEGLSKEAYVLIDLMSACRFVDVTRAGLLCERQYRRNHTNLSLRLKLRLFLKPFFVIRNQSKGITGDIN